MWTEECGMWNVECGMFKFNFDFLIPQTSHRNPLPRKIQFQRSHTNSLSLDKISSNDKNGFRRKITSG